MPLHNFLHDRFGSKLNSSLFANLIQVVITKQGRAIPLNHQHGLYFVYIPCYSSFQKLCIMHGISL